MEDGGGRTRSRRRIARTVCKGVNRGSDNILISRFAFPEPSVLFFLLCFACLQSIFHIVTSPRFHLFSQITMSNTMAINCSDVPSNISYNCAKPWGQGCKSKAGFDFKDLWSYTQNIQKACPTDPRLFGYFSTPQNASLTPAACIAIAGKGWHFYPGVEIWGRVTNWKLPLLQLVVSLPRPPLSSWVEWFVIVHLLGNPIDTIRNLLLKLSTCDRRAGYWRTELPNISRRSAEHGQDRDWKALTIVVDAYDEWGGGRPAISALEQAL